MKLSEKRINKFVLINTQFSNLSPMLLNVIAFIILVSAELFFDVLPKL